MAIVRWDPFRDITTLQERINRLFDDAFPRSNNVEDDMVCSWRPMVDIYEAGRGIIIKVDLPGVEKEDVSVEVKENVLTIKGERRTDTAVDEQQYFRRERTCGNFQRNFTLRYLVSPDQIKASFKNGVLKVEIPKPEEEKPKQVNVNIE